MRRFVTSLFALLLLAVIALAFPSLASAHDVLQKTTPSDGATLQRMPSTVSLQFAEPPLAIGTQVLVKGPSGDVADGKPTIEGNVVVQAISDSAPAGSYTVTYRVTSDDGHPIGGTFTFKASASQDGGTGATTAPMSVTPLASATPQANATPRASVAAGASQATSAPIANESSSLVPVLLSIVGVLVVLAIGAFFVLRRRQQQ
ncbi:MAG: copper resistance protein CopC [Humibacillus sp.]|nr:copper resistance protein CopC [Humibacillus sp.]MDN5777652.1 copper resistance protein CopC [Humibacillus sp.]